MKRVVIAIKRKGNWEDGGMRKKEKQEKQNKKEKERK